MQIVMDPALKDYIEYDIWKDRNENEWVCVAGHLPFLGAISGHGATPEAALKECLVAIDLAFDTFNKP